MSWLLRHRVRHYVQSSLFLAPITSIVLALLVAPVVRTIDDQTRWSLFGFGAAGASAVVSGLASSIFGLIVFSFSILLLAIQIAGGQLSPRIIARIFRTPLIRWTVALFVFTYTYSLAALGRIGDRVPQLPVALAIVFSLMSLASFLYLVQRMGEEFRPGTVMTKMGERTRAVLDAIYPAPFTAVGGDHASFSLDPATADRTVEHRNMSGVVLAFDARGLTELAERSGCIIELVPEVGDFLAVGEPMFRLYGAGAGQVSETRLRDSIAIGGERTMEQDPTFGFRIIVDIASKALSPAINDPTTGTLAIDQIHRLLLRVSRLQLDTGVIRDSAGTVRFVYRTPDWEDFVTLGGTEIRMYGATSPQIPRRLRAMYEQLLRAVPPERAPALRREVELLDATIEAAYPDPRDRALAGTSDLQGFGSRSRG
ncbi:MAG: DUF2254 domain-containing protein [Thermoanaerobaculia bacterium]|jgi:uncharacterized membrane protein